MTDNGMQSLQEQLAFMQKRVRVTLDWLDEEAHQIGTLVGLSEDGQATLLDDAGIRHYCWPVLKIEEVHGDIAMPEIEEPKPRQTIYAIFAGLISFCILVMVIALTVKVVMWVIQ